MSDRTYTIAITLIVHPHSDQHPQTPQAIESEGGAGLKV